MKSIEKSKTSVVKIHFLEYREKSGYRAPFLSEIRLLNNMGRSVRPSSVDSSSGKSRGKNVLSSSGEWFPNQEDFHPWIALYLDNPQIITEVEYVQNLKAHCLIDCTPSKTPSSLLRGTPTSVKIETSGDAKKYAVQEKTTVQVKLN